MNALIAYYSRRGENLVNGTVQKLIVGNTELLASIIQKLTGCDCYHIEPVKDYSKSYYRCIDQARQDLCRGVRPELKHPLDSIEAYDIIYLGYPNYWGTMPAAVFSFLEQFDFTGKILKPFCTHEGGGMGHSERDIKRICPTAYIASALPIRGTEVNNKLTFIEDWVNETLGQPAKMPH